MELYKNRSFGAMFQDTFFFLKKEGKHFFKQYFIINGIFLLMLSVLAYFFSDFYGEFFKTTWGLKSAGASSFDTYLNENLAMIITLGGLFVLVAITAGIVAYAFPPIYFKNYLECGSGKFDTADILNSYKKNSGKLLIFIISGILLGILLAVPLFATAFVLIITIVGILGLPLLFGGLMLFYTMTLMEYLEDKKSIWNCFGYAWSLLKSNFIVSISCVGLFYLISYVIQQVLTIIPYFFGMINIFTSSQQGNLDPSETANTFMFILLTVFFVSFLVGSVLGTVTQVNQGIIFYSLKEQNENIRTKSIIDQIGASE